MPEKFVLRKLEVEVWVKPGYDKSVQEVVERALLAAEFVKDFGVDLVRDEK